MENGFLNKMSEQQIMKFPHSHSFFEEDFIFEDTNKNAYELIYKFPKWSNNLVNLVGPKKSGKTHLLKILEKKHSFYYVNEKSFNNQDLDNLFETQKLILDFNKFSEKELFLLVNDFYTNKKYLIISSNVPLIQMSLNLKDLVSRSKLFNITEIFNPSDKLVYSLILKFYFIKTGGIAQLVERLFCK